MSNRDDIEGLMAASLYEPLSPDEQRELDAWLAAHPEDRAELDAMRKLVDFVPDTAPAFAGDLRPVLREELLRGAGRRFSWAMLPRFAFQVAGVLAITLVFAIPVWQGTQQGFVLPMGEQLASINEPAKEFGDDITGRVKGMLDRGDYNAAHALLTEQLALTPAHTAAGDWQKTLAKLEFEHFNRYAQAYEAYERLRGTYGMAFASDPENAYRYDVLEQTREDRFEPLYLIAKARENGMASFHDLERVVARYSGRGNPVAELALNAMSEVSGALSPSNGVFEVAGYEQVRRRCSDPLAIAQLNDKLGQLYLAHTGDVARARQLFQEVVDCGSNTPLAAEAQMSLASLETRQ